MAQLPAIIERQSPRVKAAFEAKSSALARTRNALARASSPIGTMTKGVAVLGGSAAAGALDARISPLPLGNGIQPSIAAGIALGVVSIPMGSPLLANVAVGMLAPSVYVWSNTYFAK